MPQFGQTYVHPLAMLLTLAMGILLLRARRSQAVLPVLLVACLIPELQRVVVAEQDFSMMRILLLFGWVKMATSRDTSRFRLQRIDVLFVLWFVCGTLVYTVREGTFGALANRLGYAFEGLSIYFLFRVLLQNASDVLRAIRVLAWIVVPMGALMIVENQTGRNPFSALGGVAEFTTMREGRLRAQGAFSHAILAGTFGASVMPMFVTLILVARPGKRMLSIAAVVSSVLVVVLSSSSGPLMALLVGALAWSLWPLRAQLGLIRWAGVALLVVLHFVREQPVWHLIGRLSSLTGGTGYHRFRLIDAFINRFGEWWLVGTSSTLHWFILNSDDLTNQFVAEGVRGGALTLVAFIAVLVGAFTALGRARRLAVRSTSVPAHQRRALALISWGLGVSLTVHCVSFISVAYFGQMLAIFQLQLAMIASFCAATQLGAEADRVDQRVLPLRNSSAAGDPV